MKALQPFDECCPVIFLLIMNLIAWNCRGALKAFFQNHIKDPVNNHNPAIVIIMETKIGGERAREITDKLPFDEVITTDTIGYAGGVSGCCGIRIGLK